MHYQSVLENKYDHISTIYHLLVDRCKKHQAAIAAGQSAPPPQPATTSISPTHLPITKFDSERRRSSITTGVGQFAWFLSSLHYFSVIYFTFFIFIDWSAWPRQAIVSFALGLKRRQLRILVVLPTGHIALNRHLTVWRSRKIHYAQHVEKKRKPLTIW